MEALQKMTQLNERTGRDNQVMVCKFCKACFSKLYRGIDHVRLHFNSKPFECPKCKKGFAQCGNRDRHVKSGGCLRRLKTSAKKVSKPNG